MLVLTGALAELLIMLDHEHDARTLQASHAEWVTSYQVSRPGRSQLNWGVAVDASMVLR